MHTIFRPLMKDNKCKHEWKKLKAKGKTGIIFGRTIEFEYLICPKCGSTSGEIITI